MQKTCPVCGAVAPLHAVEVLARGNRRTGGDGVVYMCSTCHAQLDQSSLRELEFEVVLADLMQASGQFSSVAMQPTLLTSTGDTGRPDIVAKEEGKTVVVECKGAQTISARRLHDAAAQLKRYVDAADARHLVLALPARISPVEKGAIAGDGVAVWDLDFIADRFRAHLHGVTHPVLRPLLFAAAALTEPGAPRSPEDRLLEELKSLEPGRGTWSQYQKLVARILERLFCPPLSSPLLENRDHSNTNRRDIILPNYSDDGFWRFVRERYDADFIVADAKNYSDLVGKAEALQILNYLKRHGAGHLGLIVTRHGADDGCVATMREHWAHQQKLLVVLNDEHIERMLRAKETGGPPEDVIRQTIEDFRLSM